MKSQVALRYPEASFYNTSLFLVFQSIDISRLQRSQGVQPGLSSSSGDCWMGQLLCSGAGVFFFLAAMNRRYLSLSRCISSACFQYRPLSGGRRCDQSVFAQPQKRQAAPPRSGFSPSGPSRRVDNASPLRLDCRSDLSAVVARILPDKPLPSDMDRRSLGPVAGLERRRVLP